MKRQTDSRLPLPHVGAVPTPKMSRVFLDVYLQVLSICSVAPKKIEHTPLFFISSIFFSVYACMVFFYSSSNEKRIH